MNRHGKTSAGIVRRLLRRNVSAVQIIGYAFASLVGLTIVLTAIQFYLDASGVFTSRDAGALQRDYLVVSKQIGLTDRTTGFTDEEIADLAAQPWVNATGAFTASRFKAAIGVDFAGRGMSTETFFESIPDQFFDQLPTDWYFDTSLGEAGDVPIVLSRDYLALYNFGFASTRGLPTLRESEISKIPLTVAIRGYDGHTVRMRGHVAGFSSRINTIAVPEDFMAWANARFGTPGGDTAPSRLVLEVNTPGDPAIAQYMRRHSLDIAGDKMDNGTAAYFLRVVTGVVIAVGAVISLLSFFILMLSIFLLLQKNRGKLQRLMLLGYSPDDVARPYITLILTVNATVLVLSCAVAWGASAMWSDALRTIGAEPASPATAFATGFIVMGAVSAINIVSVRRRMGKDFR